MAKHAKKVRSRTAAWLVAVAMMALAGVGVGQLASATTSGGTTTTTVAGGGALPFTGAASVPMLFAALALLGLGAASLVAGARRRRRA
jgi:predicted anti-sigma-YlaC factor YlaD